MSVVSDVDNAGMNYNRRSLGSASLNKQLDEFMEKEERNKESLVLRVARKMFPVSPDPLHNLGCLGAWISLLMAIFLFSTRIWFTPQIVIINPYLIVVGSVHLAVAIMHLIILYFIERALALKSHFILYCIAFVLEITAWLVLLAEISVVSGPDSTCASVFGCVTISAFTLAFGIFFTVFSLILLVLMIPLIVLFYEHYHKVKLSEAKRAKKK